VEVNMMANSQLRTSSSDRWFLGVCGGLAEWTGISSVWFRLFFLLTAIPGGIPGVTLYLLMWLVMPKGR